MLKTFLRYQLYANLYFSNSRSFVVLHITARNSNADKAHSYCVWWSTFTVIQECYTCYLLCLQLANLPRKWILYPGRLCHICCWWVFCHIRHWGLYTSLLFPIEFQSSSNNYVKENLSHFFRNNFTIILYHSKNNMKIIYTKFSNYSYHSSSSVRIVRKFSIYNFYNVIFYFIFRII